MDEGDLNSNSEEMPLRNTLHHKAPEVCALEAITIHTVRVAHGFIFNIRIYMPDLSKTIDHFLETAPKGRYNTHVYVGCVVKTSLPHAQCFDISYICQSVCLLRYQMCRATYLMTRHQEQPR